MMRVKRKHFVIGCRTVERGISCATVVERHRRVIGTPAVGSFVAAELKRLL